MQSCSAGQAALDPSTQEFYCRTLTILTEAGMNFLVGGAYAFARYTGIERHTKDFDIFARRSDCESILAILSEAGYKIELTFPHWLGKAFSGGDFVDVIFSGGNGVAEVDDQWFEHAVEGEVLGKRVKLCPAEEMIWSKAYVCERERYDGADIAHLIRARGPDLDWPRLLSRFDEHWQVLASHLILFRFIYPAERDSVPQWVMREMIARLDQELSAAPPAERVCQGTLLSRQQYLIDVDHRGYEDARLVPRGNMTGDEIAHWTAAIESEK